MFPGYMFKVGNHFMQNYYTVFDYDNGRIGLGNSLVATHKEKKNSLTQSNNNSKLKLNHEVMINKKIKAAGKITAESKLVWNKY